MRPVALLHCDGKRLLYFAQALQEYKNTKKQKTIKKRCWDPLGWQRLAILKTRCWDPLGWQRLAVLQQAFAVPVDLSRLCRGKKEEQKRARALFFTPAEPARGVKKWNKNALLYCDAKALLYSKLCCYAAHCWDGKGFSAGSEGGKSKRTRCSTKALLYSAPALERERESECESERARERESERERERERETHTHTEREKERARVDLASQCLFKAA